ncbi:MAG TPA: hypothetical protein VD994_09680 [Prosthecobacter sp.]|nr:hypothetical protein [Prosthecobacter sp.]
MSSKSPRQIFLSAVSREFRRCRVNLKLNLMGPDLPCVVSEQDDFAVSGMTLLKNWIATLGSVVR